MSTINLTINGNKISVDTSENAARSKAIALTQTNADLVELAGIAPDQVGAWFDGLSATRRANLLKAVIVKISELDRRIAALEAQKR